MQALACSDCDICYGDKMSGKEERDTATDRPVSFTRSRAALAAMDNERERKSTEVILNWYLGWCKREGQRASMASAAVFLEGIIRERQPAKWIIGQWRKGLRWFFRAARRQGHERYPERGEAEVGTPIAEIGDPWEDRLVRAIRRENLMLRTE